MLVLVILKQRLLCNPEEKNIGALQGVSEKTRSGLTLPSLSGCHCQTLVWELVYPLAGTYSFRFTRSLSPSASFPFRRWVTVNFALAGKLRVRVVAFSTSKIDNGDGPGCSSGSDTLVASSCYVSMVGHR